MHDKVENNNLKNNIYFTLSLLGFCLQSLRKSEKWTDIVKSLLKYNTVSIPSLYSDKIVLLTVSTPFLAKNAFSTQDVEYR